MMASQLLDQVYATIDSRQRLSTSLHYLEIENLREKAEKLREIITKADRPLTQDEITTLKPK